jgi:Domain of unknown function (DUF4136)
MEKPVLILGVLLLLFGCSPNPAEDLSAEETDMVITRKDTAYNYQKDSLYAILDFVLEILPDTIIPSDIQLDRDMIQEVRDQMAAYGYRETDTNDLNLNVALVMTKFTIENSGAVNGGYWFGYPGYWNPWFVGYPGTGWYYPGYTYVYSYETGSVILAMFDWPKRDEQYQVPVWEAGLRGVLSSNPNNNSTRALWGINQAFVQSPYLDHN